MREIIQFLKSITIKCKNSFCRVLEWKKDKVWAWILKMICLLTIIGGVVCLLIWFYKYIVPTISTIFIGSILVLLYYSETIEAWWQDRRNIERYKYMQVPALSEEMIAGILMESLVQLSSLLDIVVPKMLGDIYPVEYSLQRNDGRCSFLRFVVRCQKHRTDYEIMRKMLNEELCRRLWYNYPNPTGQIIAVRMGNDIMHAGSYYVDILFVDNANTYEYVKELECQRRRISEERVISDVEDKEF